jgi:quercetin dioxygenase-like cupin family protein
MDFSRREVNVLFSLLTGLGQARSADGPVLPSHCYNFPDLTVSTNAKTGAKSREVFHGTTHDGFPVDLHITTMPPGEMPHPAHRHPHEEMMLIQQGSLEVTIEGKKTVVGPGSVIYIHSNDEHGLKCTGNVPAQYFVLALGHKTE